MKEKFKKLGEQVAKNKGKIIFVGGVAVGFVVFKKFGYKINIGVAETTQIKDGTDVWSIFGEKESINPELMEELLRNGYSLID